MNKNILVSCYRDDSLNTAIEELKSKGNTIVPFRKKLNLDLRKSTSLILFILLFPLLYLSNFAHLAYLKKKHKINSLLCLDWHDKLLISSVANILKIKTTWIELPDADFKVKKLLLLLYKRNSRKNSILVFNNLTKQQLTKNGVKEENIHLVSPAAKLDQRKGNPGAAQAAQFSKKFFVVGTFSDLDKDQNIETLFQAIKICTEVIPNIQLIIVGEGEERKNLGWLAKKMGIDGLVWMVGEQGQTRKWLDNFDVFVVSKKSFRLPDLEMILKGMASELPVIGPSDSGLEEIVEDNRNGYLVDPGNSELFARQIMKLGQDERLRLKLGQIAKEKAEELFTLEKQIKSIEEMI